MARAGIRLIVSGILLTAMTVLLTAQERDRSKVADKYKWNLAEVYATPAAWRAQKEKITAELPKIREFEGTLSASPKALADALELMSRLDKELTRLYVYASMLSDEDTRVSKYQGMQQEMVQVNAQLGAEAAFIEPEILKTDRATIDRFVASERCATFTLSWKETKSQ